MPKLLIDWKEQRLKIAFIIDKENLDSILKSHYKIIVDDTFVIKQWTPFCLYSNI